MAWLGTWANRKKIIIDNTNIDSDLTHFPVPIVLGTSVGQSDQDVSDIFDELGSNSIKIAITKSDGTTQVYGEIEQWDAANEKALIWVSKSDLTLSASSANEFYFYYDPNQSDNTSYIGNAGDRTEAWISALKLRIGMNSLTDSTSNNNDGTANGGVTVGAATGQIGKATNFDGSNDYITISNSSEISFNDTFSIGYWVYHDVTGIAEIAVAKRDSSTNYQCYKGSDESIRFYDGNSERIFSTNIPNQTFTYIVFTIDSSDNISLYVDGVFKETIAGSVSWNNSNLFLGSFNSGQGAMLNGILDEVRIFNTVLTAAWIKADYHAQMDNLITFSTTDSGLQTALADMAMDIKTWQEKTNNVPLDIHAASWTMAAINLDCHTALQSMSDTIVDIYALGEHLKNQKVDISVGSLGIDNVMLSMQLSSQLFRNAFLDIFLTDGTIRQNACMDVAASDGNKKENLGLDMMAVSTRPEFKSVYAINLSSVIKEITA